MRMPSGDDSDVENILSAISAGAHHSDSVAIAIRHAVSVWQKVKEEEAILYEKRTAMIEKMAMALEHYNEQKFHSVL
jgi:hypothetical protein